MAYGNNNAKKPYQKKQGGQAPKSKSSGGFNEPVAAVKVKIEGQEDLIRLTGLFHNVNEETGKTSISGKTREDITIPAGSRIFFFDNTQG